MEPWATPEALEPIPDVAERTTFSIVWRRVEGSSNTCRNNSVAKEVKPQNADTWQKQQDQHT